MQLLQRFSLFLTPCDTDFAYLGSLIGEITATRNAYPFEPHVTVYSGSCNNNELLEKFLAEAVRGVSPIALKTAGIGCGPEYFKSLFIRFDEDVRVRLIHDRLKQALGEDSGYRLLPHLSLLYQDLPMMEKEALAQSITLDRPEILFDAVKIVAPPVEGWRDTTGWRTMFSMKLGGGEE